MLKNKIILLISLILLLSCFFISNNCYASTISYNDNTYDIASLPFDVSEHPDYLILYYTNGKGYQVAFPASDYDLPFFRTGGDGIQYRIKGSNTWGQWNYYNYTISTSSWSSMGTTIQREAKIYSNGNHVSDLIFSTVDVNYLDGTSFFQVPPLTLEGIMKKAGEQATMEVGQVILVVIMTTAGLIVLLIGLKKGLKVLVNGFRH